VEPRLVTEAAEPGQPNEDFTAATTDAMVVLDGATTLAGQPTGCCHGVAWYARTLGSLFLAAISPNCPLTGALAEAIDHVTTLHRGTCDVGHPGTPSATAAAARIQAGVMEHLVLGDCTVLLDRHRVGPLAVSDDRLGTIVQDKSVQGARAALHALPAGSPEHSVAHRELVEALAACRNRPGGFWVASTDPRAAAEALTGTIPVSELSAVALLSDGAARLADRFGLADWPIIAALLAAHGPAEVIRRTRAAEDSDPDGTRWPRAKPHDDATVAYWPLGPP